MQFISSTLVEFEQQDITPVEPGKLLAHTPELLDNPLFYPIAEEFPITLRSLTFPWMCRKNLRIMQTMTLYRMEL